MRLLPPYHHVGQPQSATSLTMSTQSGKGLVGMYVVPGLVLVGCLLECMHLQLQFVFA